MWTDVVGALSMATAALAAVFGLPALYSQLKRAAQANETSSLMMVLTLEDSIARARRDLAEALAALAAASAINSAPNVHLATLTMKERLEQYLNCFDRLCAFIRRGHINEIVYRKDYRDTVIELVTNYPAHFGADTRHRNLLFVYGAWKDDRSATD